MGVISYTFVKTIFFPIHYTTSPHGGSKKRFTVYLLLMLSHKKNISSCSVFTCPKPEWMCSSFCLFLTAFIHPLFPLEPS